MTDRIRQKNYVDCLIVAPGDWPERIRGRLRRRFDVGAGESSMMDCRDIYEAAAQIMESQGRGRGVLVYVLVDSMPEAEMQFFRCWSGNEKVRTVALSMAGRQGKLTQALVRGADEAMLLNGQRSAAQALTLSPPVVETPPQVAATVDYSQPKTLVENEAVGPEETAEIEDIVLEDDQPNPTELDEAVQAEPAVPALTPKAQGTEPLLTEDELNALLS